MGRALGVVLGCNRGFARVRRQRPACHSEFDVQSPDCRGGWKCEGTWSDAALAVALFAFGKRTRLRPAAGAGIDDYPRAYYYGGYYGYGAPAYYVYGAPAIYGYAGSGPVYYVAPRYYAPPVYTYYAPPSYATTTSPRPTNTRGPAGLPVSAAYYGRRYK